MTKALQGVGLGLLDQHLHHCVMAAAQDDGGEGDAKLDEAMTAIERMLRS